VDLCASFSLGGVFVHYRLYCNSYLTSRSSGYNWGDILHWEYLDFHQRIEFLRWMAMEILGVVLSGIGLGVLFYDLKKSISKFQS